MFRLIIYLILILVVQSACNRNAIEVNSLVCSKCSDKTYCKTLIKCGAQYFNGFYERRINDSLSLDKILSCTIEEAKKGNRKAHKLLYDYFQKRYNYYLEANYPASAIADFYYTREVEIFSEMRGVDIFELALEFAKDTKCIDHGDMAGGGNLGISVIEYIINPMIKSVGGKGSMGMYLYVDNYKNSSIRGTSTDPCIRSHEVNYGELIKAYKEGKIVLKKYGED